MRKLNIILCAALMVCLVNQGISQNVLGSNPFATDINGRPMYAKTEYIAQGSPYFYDDYCLAEVTTTTGKVYPETKIKFNIMENLVLYILNDGTEMIATTPIAKIKFYDYFKEGKVYPSTTLQSIGEPINKDKSKIYALLVDSTARLYKQISITYDDSKGYGEATVTRTFKREENYFALIPGISTELQKFTKNKSSVSDLFGKQKEKVSTYIDQQKLNCKSEKDLIRIFSYYHTLN